MIEELFEIERDAYKTSVIHRLDARVKIVIAFAAIIALVAVPYSTMIYTVGAIFFAFFFILWCCSRLPLAVYAKRLLSILPLWGIIIFFQIFVKNKYYTDYTVVVSLPWGINIYAESIEFAFILLVKFIVTVSFIILLSSTTKMPELLEGASRMGLPAEFALALGMMIRYLFVFGYMYRKINETLKTKCFDAFDRHLPYRYRLNQTGLHHRHHVYPFVRAGGKGIHQYALSGIWQGKFSLCDKKTPSEIRVGISYVLPQLYRNRSGDDLGDCSPSILTSIFF